LSTKAFSRILWIVFDGLGYEHARRCMGEGFTAIARLSSEGYLGPSRPSTPACETPSALYTLFSGIEPSESGIWGYQMPNPAMSTESISGFTAQPRSGQTLWSVLEAHGDRYSLMNVAFRNDPVWTDGTTGLDIGCDAYRIWKKPSLVKLKKGFQDFQFGGIELRALRTQGGVKITKGVGSRAHLSVGEGTIIRLTAGLSAYACLLDNSHLVLSRLTAPMLRGSIHPASVDEGILDLNVFQLARSVNESSPNMESISMDTEMAPALYGMRQKESLILEAIRGTNSKLVIGYIPLIDEFNHVYMDQLETEWPEGRVSGLFTSCMHFVDSLLAKVMAMAGPDTLLVVSSDHGAVPYRRMIHMNELLAGAGLVRLADDGYDLRRSIAYYHPSNCGLIAMQPQSSRPDVLRRLRHVLDAARMTPGTEIGMVELREPGQYPAFLYPMADSKLTASPLRRGGGTLDNTKAGGHHLSPLTPTPWIQAMLGLWSPRSQKLGSDLAGIPTENRQLKAFLLDLLH
jgi:hypothetical protein